MNSTHAFLCPRHAQRGLWPLANVLTSCFRICRIASLPSDISFWWEVSTAHFELFTPEKTAWVVGGFMHFLHLFIRIVQIRKIPDSDLGWEDMYREDEGEDWFDWVRASLFSDATKRVA